MNVVVIACNGLHLGFLGCYGNPWVQTPAIDRLASQAVVFDHHFPDNLTTLPTRRSWWTGRYGFHDPGRGWTPLPCDEVILPDLLWDHGVRTALISDVPYLREPGFGYGRGFDEVAWIRGAGYDPWITADHPLAGSARTIADEPGLRLPHPDDPDHGVWRERWEQLLRNRAGREVFGSSLERASQRAIDWLSRQDDQPFLLWLDLFSPHGPWDLPASFRDLYATIDPEQFDIDESGDLDSEEVEEPAGEDAPAAVATLIDVPPGSVGDVLDDAELLRLKRTYAGAVTQLDHHVGKLLEALERAGRDRDTLVIFTADQGEPLGEHGYVRRFVPWLHEELVHTPLILRLPGGAQGGRRHQAFVQSVDLLPTILSALDAPEDPSLHGQDLLSLIDGQNTKFRDFACMGMDGAELALRTHNWHLIVSLEQDPDNPRPAQLYRKPEDRWEQQDVADQFPDVAEHLELALRRFAAAVEGGRDELDNLPPLRDLARFTSS